MFCPRCGAEIVNNMTYCPKCGTTIKTNYNNSSLNRTTTSKKKNDAKYIIIAISAFIVWIVVNIIPILMFNHIINQEKIVGVWKECGWIEDGVSKQNTDFTYRDVMEFYKDGSFKRVNNYVTLKGTWKNITRDADDNPTYYMEEIGFPEHAIIQNNKLYISDEYTSIIRVYKKVK